MGAEEQLELRRSARVRQLYEEKNLTPKKNSLMKMRMIMWNPIEEER